MVEFCHVLALRYHLYVLRTGESPQEELEDLRSVAEVGLPGLRLNDVGARLTGNLHKTTALEVDSVPAVLLKDLEVKSRPGGLSYFLPRQKLEVDGEGKIATTGRAPIFVLNEHRGDRLRD